MAYNKTIINYYTNGSIIKDAYAANISSQIQRIEDAHNAIRSKAIDLGLLIPAGAPLTHNASGTSPLALTADHHILDTAAAINNIAINQHTSKSLAAGATYTVPVGYNAVEYVITASGLTDQTTGTALAQDILAGKTAWVNGELVTGIMANLAGNRESTNFGSYTKNGSSYLQVAVPATGKYTEGSFLQSEIKYITPADVEVPVTIITGQNGETIVDSSKLNFAPGYYSGAFNVHAVYEKGENKVINISNTVGATLSAQTGKLTIPKGFDYLAPNASYEIQTGSVAAVTRTVNSETGEITFAGGEITAGWLSGNVTKPANYKPVAAEYSVNAATGLVTVTVAGWITKGTTLGGLTPGSATLEGPSKATSATTIGGTSIAANDHYVKLTTTAGFIGSETKAINLGTAKTTTVASSATSGGTKMTSKRWKVTTTKGYNPSDVKTELYAQDGVITPTVAIKDDNTCQITVSQAGWVDAKTIAVTIAAEDQKCVLDEAALGATNVSGDGKCEVTVQAAPNTFMKSLSIDTSILFNRLASI